MRLTGEITCRLSENGIKPGILYCNEPEAYRLSEWSLGAAWATALFTVVLAIMAWRAWRTSQSALKATLDQLQITQDLAKEDRKERASMASRENLAKHLTAWSAVRHSFDAARSAYLRSNTSELSRSAKAEFRNCLQEVEATGMVWRMLHADQKSQLEGGRQWSQLIVKAAQLEVIGEGESGDSAAARRGAILSSMGRMLELFQLWETDEETRPETSRKISEEKNRFKDQNETLRSRREALRSLEEANARMAEYLKSNP